MSGYKLHPEVKPMTMKEIHWIARLEKLLKSCPSERLGLVTIGDPSLTVIDDSVVRKYDLEIHDGLAERHGVVLAHVNGNVTVHGVSG